MALVYRLLESSDADYARFLHEEGYAPDEGPKRFKLFVFSGLRARNRRSVRVVGETLWLAPGPVDWYLSSPVEAFLTHFATGLLSRGVLWVGEVTLPVAQAQTCPAPDFSSGIARLTCLTPVVASVAGENGGKRYLRAAEGTAFSEAVHRNLRRKYAALRGHALETSAPFALTWDADYLARNSHGGQKKIRFKQIDVIGVQSPCTLSADPSLLELAYDVGLGELNSGGFGMVEVISNEK